MSKQTYQEAFEELQQIVSDLEDGQISVDELSEKVNRASALIKVCKAKLTTTEDNVQKILAAIEQPDPETTEGNVEEGNEDKEAEDFPF